MKRRRSKLVQKPHVLVPGNYDEKKYGFVHKCEHCKEDLRDGDGLIVLHTV